MKSPLLSWKGAFVAVTLLGGAIGAASAQGADAALLAVVTDAVDKTLAVSSMAISQRSQTEITLGQGMTLTQASEAQFVLAQGLDGWNAQGSTSSTTSTPVGALEITSEVILLNNRLYARLGETPQLQGAQGNLLQGAGAQQELPEGWFEVTAQSGAGTADQAAVPNVEISADAAAFLDALALPLDAQTVLSLNEITPDTIDGQAMRVVQVTVDAEAVASSEAASLLSAGGFGGMLGGQLPQGGQFPAGGQLPQGAQLPEGVQPPDTLDEMRPPDFSSAQITFAVYIGAQDGLVHRVYSVVAVPGGQGQAAFTTTTISDYSAFNAPVTISAPEIGS
jgi:hypothetical protein